MTDINKMNTTQLTILLERARRKFMLAIEKHRPSGELAQLRERIVDLESRIVEKERRVHMMRNSQYVA